LKSSISIHKKPAKSIRNLSQYHKSKNYEISGKKLSMKGIKIQKTSRLLKAKDKI
jgi:hypothetical protein